jgi:hypothetical protein
MARVASLRVYALERSPRYGDGARRDSGRYDVSVPAEIQLLIVPKASALPLRLRIYVAERRLRVNGAHWKSTSRQLCMVERQWNPTTQSKSILAEAA